MRVIATTFAGEKLTIRNKTITESLAILRDGGVSEDWVFTMEAQQDEAVN